MDFQLIAILSLDFQVALDLGETAPSTVSPSDSGSTGPASSPDRGHSFSFFFCILGQETSLS